MLAAPRSGMDAPRRSAMQLSESLLLHWRHWMRSVNDTAREAICARARGALIVVRDLQGAAHGARWQ